MPPSSEKSSNKPYDCRTTRPVAFVCAMRSSKRSAGHSKAEFLDGRRLIERVDPLLLEITPPNYAEGGIPRPDTALNESSLFTGSPSDPQLVHELGKEMRSADAVDILISFIKWSGVRLLVPAFEEITRRGGRVRVITTSYMGASDAEAVEWLAKLPNVENPGLVRHGEDSPSCESIIISNGRRVSRPPTSAPQTCHRQR